MLVRRHSPHPYDSWRSLPTLLALCLGVLLGAAGASDAILLERVAHDRRAAAPAAHRVNAEGLSKSSRTRARKPAASAP